MRNCLTRIRPLESEALTGFIQRVAKANYATPHELWRATVGNNKRYPQASMARLIDLFPSSVLNVELLSNLCGIDISQIAKHTFSTVLQKVLPSNLTDREIRSKRTLSECIHKYRRICPECLKDKPYYMLLFQIEEVNFCLKHKVELLDHCPKCLKPINLLGPDSVVGFCERCLFDFRLVNNPPFEILPINKRIVEDWECLLDPSLTMKKDFTATEHPSRLLYLLNNCALEFSKETALQSVEPRIISNLLQIVRQSKVSQSFVKITTILQVLRAVNVSIEEYLNLEVPREFVSFLVSSTVSIKRLHSCLAPWCKSFGKAGSLKKTGTSKRELKNRNTLHYYMYCEDCAIEYAIDKLQGSIVERGYFISLAWYQVRPQLHEGKSIRQIAKNLNTTIDKVRRSVIFLFTNGLIDRNYLDVSFPENPDLTILEFVLHGVSEGINAKNLCTSLGLTSTEFLYYWFLPVVALTRINRKLLNPSKRDDIEARTLLVERCLEQLIKDDIPITISRVCNHLHLNKETLRLWGVLPLIKEARKTKRHRLLEQRNAKIIEQATEIVDYYKNKGLKILSEELYLALGINRRFLVRDFPEVTKCLTHLLKNQ